MGFLRGLTLILVLCIAALSGVAAPAAGIIGGADGPTRILVAGAQLTDVLEAQLSWLSFQDAADGEVRKISAALGEIADAYALSGRAAQGGFTYFVGVGTAENSPLQGLTSSQVWGPGADFWWVLTPAGGDEPTYSFKDMELYFDPAAPDILIATPHRPEGPDYGALFQMIAEGKADALLDATARGVNLCPPPTPHLAVHFLAEGGWRAEYIPLTEEDLMAALLSSRIVTPEEMGRRAISLVKGDGMDGESGFLSGYFYQMAAERCGFWMAFPEEIGEIVRARMTAVDRSGAAHAEEIADPALLAELAEILKSAKSMAGASACPFTGVLTLTMADGSEMIIRRAADGCPTMIFGSAACYEITAAESARFWDIFSETYKKLP